MSRIRSSLHLAVLAFLLAAGLAFVRVIRAEGPDLPAVRGAITAVNPPDGFDVGGFHVVTSSTTEFFFLGGRTIGSGDAPGTIRIGAYVQVTGDKNRRNRTVVARRVGIREDARVLLSGFGVIDRMVTPNPQPIFRADGYLVRLAPDATVRFKGEIKSIDEIDAGTWARFEGHYDNAGELLATRAEFIKAKPHKSKVDPASVAQVTTFPPGSLIDYDGRFNTNINKHRPEDAGGECGWYPVPDVPAAQENVRSIGMRLIPKYQRDLPDDSPEKIHFRFYVVEEKNIRSDLSCHDGLVLVPAAVINRVRSQDQLAAVLADGVAAGLERQQTRLSSSEEIAFLAAVPAIGLVGAGSIAEPLVRHEMQRKMEDARGRVALGLLADAGYDPWQAPEAWRLLDPKQLPKDISKVKYPARAQYQLEILGIEYPPAARSVSAVDDRSSLPSK